MSTLIVFLTSPYAVAVGAALIWGGALWWLHRQARPGLRLPVRQLRSRPLLTANEREFYGRLQGAAAGTGLQVVPQVAMAALIDVALPAGHPEYWAVRRQFAQKIVDFVVCEARTLRIVAVVELDDRTHDQRRDAARDALLAAAGLRTIRWDSRAKPKLPAIRERLQQVAAEVLGQRATNLL